MSVVTGFHSEKARALRGSVLGMLCILVFSLACAVPAGASASCSGCSPWWHVTSGARPTYLPPAVSETQPGMGQIVVTAANLGDAPVHGETSPVTITDTLPEALVVVAGAGHVVARAGGQAAFGAAKCAVVKNVPSCVFEHELSPYAQIEMIVDVKVEEGAHSGEQNEVSVSGGGAPAVSMSRGVTIAKAGQATPFGVEGYELTDVEAGGGPDTLAGSHPFETTFTLALNQAFGGVGSTGKAEALPAAMAKDLSFKLPPGLVGNPTPFPECSLAQFSHKPRATCSSSTVLGVATIVFDEPGVLGLERVSVPVFNLEPEKGEPARFGFLVTEFTPVFVDTGVRSGEDYGIVGKVENITQTAALISSEVTFWGVPGDSRHDASRGYDCLAGEPLIEPCQPLEAKEPPPFFEMPSSCSGPMLTSVAGDSWTQPLPPGSLPTLASATLPALSGCNRLPFHPSIAVTPDNSESSTASGLLVDVHNPQQESLNAEGLGEADVRDITVALPEGVAVNPSGGDGLQACSEGLVGFQGFGELPSQPGLQTALFKGLLPGSVGARDAVDAGEIPAAEAAFEPGIDFCANASKIGTATVRTPLLAKPLEGSVYLATQNENPFGSLIAMYIVAEEEASGVLVKLAGTVHLTDTGQLVSTFENSPQAPFEDAELHFFGGERAPLATPARCGAYETAASFAPWSAEPWDEAAVTAHAKSTFAIASGPHGSPCPGASLPFSPSLTGGTININAGSFSQLTTTIGRQDGQQNMQSVKLTMPPGVSGLLSGVKLCGEAASQRRRVRAGIADRRNHGQSAGVGSDPVTVTGGKVYITEKYDGAPFGLSIVNPVKAGPFDLEHDTSKSPQYTPACDCIVVRAKVEVAPLTAALTVTTDASGPHAIPHMIDGVPVQIKKVNVLINRPGFTFNPTDCAPLAITGSIASDEGASSPVSVPFQVANCANLAFKPSFKVSTSGKTSRQIGVSLHVNLAYPKAPFGSQANIAKVKVDLPKQLPSNLPALQQACPHATFAANPAACSPNSRIGEAKATTPLLPVPLAGPVYFVSHGGAQFPELVIVLSGYGVTVQLHAETFIKNGITSSTFNTIPDVPVGTFELTLHQGKYSALAAPGNKLCQTKLAMPTLFTAQNGATIKQSTPISVTGCPKHKAKKKNHRGKKATQARGKRRHRAG